jgi:S-formylglutathione hydrolase
MKTVSENRAFGGVQGVYSHASTACACDMTFGLYLPAEAEEGPVPLLWFLSGLTCTHENAMVKAGAQRWAAESGIALVFPDTSPRGPGVANDPASDLGQGAGFYVNATQTPWAPAFPHVGLCDGRASAPSVQRLPAGRRGASRSPAIRWADMAP